MAVKAYISDVSPWWTIERQEAVLSASVPGWPIRAIFRDELTLNQRRGHRPERLTGRTEMLRPTTRKAKEFIHVASLAVLAWSVDDFRSLMETFAARGSTILCAEDGSRWEPGSMPIAAWRAARMQSRLEGAAKRGGEASAAKRKAKALEGFERIRDRWGMPSSEWPTAVLLEEAGVSRNTVNAHLGVTREVAQKRYQASLRRKARRQKEGENGS